ncbi:hypothetical protein GUITHDRAFT_64987 [Guillardia theta CCMP2712]|uniref:Uncharacterized protein n=1 Tax=Guillardia theta (strain CCMP2712) TaxID=905079 RepID=L1JWA9_GUITC|nr:hypothetical protein GUITHDRAFT_64987 [Guillardia theta CCMP2712]EKX52490.1 hypothetical protein GUITHDRAFT_64987 [Guillardia theta CCMP2712]|eukprot:XP_005839470.1 hypothetical protein GUITHDRAFT_64987 [Guillardia theta CCMP2712]
MPNTFSGKNVLVTGATSGIGKATGLRFLELGAKVQVTFLGRNKEVLEQIFEQHKHTGRVFTTVADLSRVEACDTSVSEAFDKMGGLDILVNNAGILIARGKNVLTTTVDEFEQTMNTNLRAPFFLIQSAAKRMQRGSVIVNVGSLAGTRTIPNLTSYSVSKAALESLTKCAALELADRGIRVNSINPATVMTEIFKRSGMSDEMCDSYVKENAKLHPLGRVGQPEDCAAMITFIASDGASWMTGQVP